MNRSLRLRLFVIIVVPLLALALAVGTWRIIVAQQTATELLDRNLMFTAIAVARDVALSDGDAISAATQSLLEDTGGGPVRYHVYAPDGGFVTGYAPPPVPVSRKLPADQPFAYYDATYRGDPARVLRLKDENDIGGLSGTFTITVWQDLHARNAFVARLAIRSLAVILTLLAAVSGLVWFGVRLGLKPLLDLEEAISQRTSEDLSPIRRHVPIETKGIVSRLNALFRQVSETMEAQSAFVSDAAHQLRNPIAGLRALAEATQTARDLPTAQSRASELARAAGDTGRLAERLLTLERARAEAGTSGLAPVDLTQMVNTLLLESAGQARRIGADLKADLPDTPVTVLGDEVMLREAITNLLDNAFTHGGAALSEISVTLVRDREAAHLTVFNDGHSVAAEDIPQILSRFGQGGHGAGSGLGLSIADAVARRHGGTLDVIPADGGFRVRLSLPFSA